MSIIALHFVLGSPVNSKTTASSVANARRTYELRAKNVDPALRRSTLTSTVSARRATFTFLDNSSAPSRPDFSAFFHSTHSAFSLRANAEAGTADHDTDTRRSRPFLNNSASFRGRLLNDVVVRKAWRHNESCQGGTGQDCSHKKSPFEFPNVFASTRMKLLGSCAQTPMHRPRNGPEALPRAATPWRGFPLDAPARNNYKKRVQAAGKCRPKKHPK
jgi:hypothetical protein